MKIDLKGMSRKELEKLQKDVAKALTRISDKELKAVRDEAAKLAAKHGYTLADITGGTSAPAKKATKAKATKTKAPAKYANPADKSQTWTGKGRQPVWYKEAIASGAAPATMEI